MAKKHQKPWTKKVHTGYYVDIDATLDISEEMYISADDVTVVGGTLVFTQDGVTVCVIEPASGIRFGI